MYFKENPLLNQHHGINLAYAGTLLTLTSMVYSLRKYRLVTWGKFRWWLDSHGILGAFGLMILLVHGQYQFRAWVPGLTLIFMILVGLTGLFGWHLYLTTIKTLLVEIKSLEDAEEYVLAKMASSAFRFWRFVHVLTALAALFFAIVHGLSLIVFRGQY